MLDKNYIESKLTKNAKNNFKILDLIIISIYFAKFFIEINN